MAQLVKHPTGVQLRSSSTHLPFPTVLGIKPNQKKKKKDKPIRRLTEQNERKDTTYPQQE